MGVNTENDKHNTTQKMKGLVRMGFGSGRDQDRFSEWYMMLQGSTIQNYDGSEFLWEWVGSVRTGFKSELDQSERVLGVGRISRMGFKSGRDQSERALRMGGISQDGLWGGGGGVSKEGLWEWV